MNIEDRKNKPGGLAEEASVLALLLTPGVGPVAVQRLLAVAQRTGCAIGALLDMPARELAELLPVGCTDAAEAVARCAIEQRKDAARLLRRAADAGVRPLLATDAVYPNSLKVFLGETAPPLLFVHGNTDLLDRPAAAIVGARAVSERGAQLASACASVFCREKVPIVSGAAPGVDTAAHTAALADGGATVVVLPQGLLTYEPPKTIHQAADGGKAVILSEFSPDSPWQPHAAVTRNATISALSSLVCVIEPKKVGGSVRTARLALQHGKQVLLYLRDPSDAIVRSLRGAGAGNLLDEHGVLSAARLLEHWRLAQQQCSGQGEFF